MRTTIKRDGFNWSAAHRLMHHDGKCINNHGHNYKAEIVVSGRVHHKTGMVLDFYLLKAIQRWIDENWDHGTILNPDDVDRIAFHGSEFVKDKLFVMPARMAEPTAENLAGLLFEKAYDLIRAASDSDKVLDFRIVSVTVWETDKLSATVTQG